MSGRATAGGLVFQIPHSDKPSSLTARLLEGRLSWNTALTSIVRHRAVIDIGANIGAAALAAIVRGGAARVYAAEPEPENFRCLVENIRANQMGERIIADRVAISDRDSSGFLRRASRMANHRLMQQSSERTIEVRTVTLDTWVREQQIDLSAVALVKVDVQGWEGRVLEGSTATLAHRHIAWMIEASPRHLSSAGSSPANFAALLAQHFTEAVDLRMGRERLAIAQVPERLSQLEAQRSYTNLLLVHHA